MGFIEQELKEFLIRAKVKTYAGDGPKSAPSRPKSKDLQYSEGNLLYIDTYLGSADFIGEEAVFISEEPVWGMNYFGRMVNQEIPEGFISFLRAAMREVTVENPFRGPELFRDGEFTYKCCWKGSFACFLGEEEIYLRDTLIYKLDFHGGYMREKI